MVVNLLILSLLCFGFVAAQLFEARSRRGSCEPIDANQVDGLLAAFPGVGMGGSARANDISVHNFRVTCESPGLERNTSSSVTLLVEYTCRNPVCGYSYSRKTGQFSFVCDAETRSYVPRYKNLLVGLSIRSAPITEYGRCGDCSSVPFSQTGCKGIWLNLNQCSYSHAYQSFGLISSSHNTARYRQFQFSTIFCSFTKLHVLYLMW